MCQGICPFLSQLESTQHPKAHCFQLWPHVLLFQLQGQKIDLEHAAAVAALHHHHFLTIQHDFPAHLNYHWYFLNFMNFTHYFWNQAF